MHDSVFLQKSAAAARGPWHNAIVPPTKDGPGNVIVNYISQLITDQLYLTICYTDIVAR